MSEKGTQNPTTATEADISKAQAAQQPPAQARQEQPETGAQPGQFETGQQAGSEQAATGQPETGAGPDEGLQGETATRQRTDIEGGSLPSKETAEVERGIVGAEGEQDTSAELVEDEEDETEFRRDGE